MQQRQLRLGDILDDYCPRERRLTNHAVVAMVGEDVKQTRCTTCEAEHEYKHAKVPRLRRQKEAAALAAGGDFVKPKRVVHEPPAPLNGDLPDAAAAVDMLEDEPGVPLGDDGGPEAEGTDGPADSSEGPVHRPLIRAILPRQEGQPAATRPAPDFTIRQPAGRVNRFRPRHQRGGGQMFQGRSNPNGSGNTMRGARPGGNRPSDPGPRVAKRHAPPRKRSK
jgi:hypothetical protein